MSSVMRFEDLDCYKLAVQIRREVLRLTRRAPVRYDFKFTSQIRDSARGGPRNISEGYSRFNPTEILQFLSYAQASLDETKNHMVDGQESEYFTQEETQQVLTLIRRTFGAIHRWRQYLDSPAARRFYEQHKARTRRDDSPAPGQNRSTRRLRKPPEPADPENS
jgi:four helix bundle protein